MKINLTDQTYQIGTIKINRKKILANLAKLRSRSVGPLDCFCCAGCCGGGGSGGTCSCCTGNVPSTITVSFSGFSNDSCTSCASLNQTLTYDQTGDCTWFKEFSTGVCPGGGGAGYQSSTINLTTSGGGCQYEVTLGGDFGGTSVVYTWTKTIASGECANSHTLNLDQDIDPLTLCNPPATVSLSS